MADRELWKSNAGSRRYDHPLDRLVQPSTEECLLYNDHQQELTREQLRDIEESDPVELMTNLARRRNDERDRWEEINLELMGIRLDIGSAALDGYMLANEPGTLPNFIEWFSEYTGALSDATDYRARGVLGFDQKLRTTDTIEEEESPSKGGYALALGSGIQLGAWEEADKLDTSIDEALVALPTDRWEVEDYKQLPKDKEDKRRHRLTIIGSKDDRGFQVVDALHVIRERPRADIWDRKKEEKLHIAKRSEVVMPFNKLNLETQRKIFGLITLMAMYKHAEIDKSLLHEEQQQFIDIFEPAIHWHEKNSGVKNDDLLPVSPLSLTYILRNPPEKHSEQ